MIPSHPEGFFSFPWPSEIRKTTGGTLDLAGFPGVELNPLDGDMLPQVPLLPAAIARASTVLTDYGTNTAVYFQSATTIDQASLPTPAGSLAADSTVMLMDLDHGGALAPFTAVADAQGTRFRPANTLSLLPYPGHPLRPGTRYAAVVFDGVSDVHGTTLPPAPLLDRLDDPWTAATGVTATQWQTLRAQRDEIVSLVESGTDWSASDIVAFTAYRTQDTDRELDAITAAMAAAPTPPIDVAEIGACENDVKAGGALTAKVTGTIAMPNWMHGAFPFMFDGGSIVIGADGLAVAQGSTATPVTARVPCGEPPAGGWPVAAYINGTGGTFDVDENRPQFNTDGWIVGVIAPLYSGATDPFLVELGIDEYLVEGLLIYNFLNPVSARFSPIQQAANHLALLHALQQLELDGSALGATQPVTASETIDLVSGHSQGAQTLSLVASMDAGIDGVFSSAGSGGQYHSLAHTRLREALALFAGEPESLDELSPLNQLVQTVLEPGDGINHPSAQHFLNVAGVADDCAAIETSRHYAGGIGLAIANRQSPPTIYGEASLDPPTVDLPASANANGSTRISLETPGGHYVASANRQIGTAFVDDLAAGRTPVVSPGPLAPSTRLCGGGRWDAPTDTFGR